MSSSRWKLVLIVALAIANLSCGGSEEEADSGSSAGGDSASAPLREVDPATTSTILGNVQLLGPPPVPAALNMKSASYCKNHEHSDQALNQELVVHDGGIEFAFVWISEGLEGYAFETPTESVLLDQIGCMYTPHVVGVQTGQKLELLNGDTILHNVHTMPKKNRVRNLALPTKGSSRSIDFKRPEIMVKTICDVHPWMLGWIGVVDHPLFAVSGHDGTFRIEGVPPGEFSLSIWQEKLGTKTVSVIVEPSAEITLEPIAFEL